MWMATKASKKQRKAIAPAIEKIENEYNRTEEMLAEDLIDAIAAVAVVLALS